MATERQRADALKKRVAAARVALVEQQQDEVPKGREARRRAIGERVLAEAGAPSTAFMMGLQADESRLKDFLDRKRREMKLLDPILQEFDVEFYRLHGEITAAQCELGSCQLAITSGIEARNNARALDYERQRRMRRSSPVVAVPPQRGDGPRRRRRR